MTNVSSDFDSRKPTVLVIGATGGVGGAVVRELLKQGWPVRALTRHADMARRVQAGDAACKGMAKVSWVQGDAMRAADVLRAAQGAGFIVHAGNPPRYARWRELALPMLAHALAAAKVTGGRLILPGNVYNFGPDVYERVAEASTLQTSRLTAANGAGQGGAGEALAIGEPVPVPVPEAAPQHPLTRKGAVRVEMEQLLWDASLDKVQPARSLVLRAGDFFGGHAPSSWLGTLLVKPGKPLRKVVYPGKPAVGHAWAYLPDLAATLVRLMALDVQQPGRLAAFEVMHFDGHWLPHGIEMAHAIARVNQALLADGRDHGSAVPAAPSLPVKPLPWGMLALLSPFVEVLREMREMRYLWEVPLRLDNRKLVALLGDEPHTPLDVAVRAALQELGCVPQGTGALEATAEAPV
jgi:nucleoside-diphosphate-sugar epimerase